SSPSPWADERPADANRWDRSASGRAARKSIGASGVTGMPIAARPNSVIQRLLPILVWLPAYRREWLLPDILAGLARWAGMVPGGLAFFGIVRVRPLP